MWKAGGGATKKGDMAEMGGGVWRPYGHFDFGAKVNWPKAIEWWRVSNRSWAIMAAGPVRASQTLPTFSSHSSEKSLRFSFFAGQGKLLSRSPALWFMELGSVPPVLLIWIPKVTKKAKHLKRSEFRNAKSAKGHLLPIQDSSFAAKDDHFWDVVWSFLGKRSMRGRLLSWVGISCRGVVWDIATRSCLFLLHILLIMIIKLYPKFQQNTFRTNRVMISYRGSL